MDLLAYCPECKHSMEVDVLFHLLVYFPDHLCPVCCWIQLRDFRYPLPEPDVVVDASLNL